MVIRTIKKHLFNKIINFYSQTLNKKAIDAICDIKLSKLKFLRLKFEGLLNIKQCFQFGIYIKENIEIKLPFITFTIMFMDTDLISPEYMNFILEACDADDFTRFQVESGVIVAEDIADDDVFMRNRIK